ncbi:hypothetical protein MMC34_007973 [Xylographa carneopallida]|nr:hypothetical protein [Xylographa carneopallida]
MPPPPVTIRPPSLSLSTPTPTTPPPSFTPPPLSFLSGTWHVTHSTLPMWKTARNVTITYMPLPTTVHGQPQLDDLVAYQPLGSAKRKTIAGVDSCARDGGGGAWEWRGKGWLKVASSRWEVLGWGTLEGSGREGEGPLDGEGKGGVERGWVVTYFAKSIFSPAGIDVYTRGENLEVGMLERINEGLVAVGDEGFQQLVETMFEVKRD